MARAGDELSPNWVPLHDALALVTLHQGEESYAQLQIFRQLCFNDGVRTRGRLYDGRLIELSPEAWRRRSEIDWASRQLQTILWGGATFYVIEVCLTDLIRVGLLPAEAAPAVVSAPEARPIERWTSWVWSYIPQKPGEAPSDYARRIWEDARMPEEFRQRVKSWETVRNRYYDTGPGRK
jgi:hypothetical protein